MAIAVRAVGAIASGTGAITPGLPAGTVKGDLLVMVCESKSGQAVTCAGWTEAPNSPQEDTTDSTRLTILWRRAQGSDARTTNDPGDHIIARIIGFSGVIGYGDPWNVTAGSTESTADTSGSIPGATTTVDNCMILAACCDGIDTAANNTTGFSAWANASLASITERIDNRRLDGDGGSIGAATGIKTTAGAYDATTVTFANTARKGLWSGALTPATPFENFNDNFDDNSLDPQKWTEWNVGDASETSNTLRFTSTAASSYKGVDSTGVFDLTGSSVVVELVQALTGLTDDGTFLQLVLNGTNTMTFMVYNDTLTAEKQIASSFTTLASTAYNNSTHRWLRIRESGGTVYYDYSADGANWTNFASAATPFAVTGLYCSLFIGTDVANAGTATAIFDNFNLPVTVTTTSKTLTGLARILATTAKTLLGKSRIIATTLKTLLGKAGVKSPDDIAYDNSSTSGILNTPGLPVIVSHTTGNHPNRILIMATAARGAVTVSNYPTYNGVNLTYLGSKQLGADQRVELWYLLNPDIGTHDLSCNFSASQNIVVACATYYNVLSIALGGNNSGSSVTSSSVANTNTTAQAIVDIIGLQTGNINPTPTASGEVVRQYGNNANMGYGLGDIMAPTTDEAASWSFATNYYAELCAVLTVAVPSTTKTLLGLARVLATTTKTLLGKAMILVVTTKTLLGKAKINITTSKTLQGISRVTSATLKTLLGKSRILATTSKTILGISRILASTAKTLLGKARILVSTAITLLGKSRILTSTTKALQGLSRVTATTAKTLLGKSRVMVSTALALLGKSRIGVFTNKTIQGISSLILQTSKTITGLASITTTSTAVKTLLGIARILVVSTKTLLGKARVLVSTQISQLGKSRILSSTTKTLSGLGRVLATAQKALLGRARVTISTLKTLLGKARVTSSTLTTLLGKAAIILLTVKTLLGKSRILASTAKVLTGISRVTQITLKTLLGKSRVTAASSFIITGISRVAKDTAKAIAGMARLAKVTVIDLLGKARVEAISFIELLGLSRIEKVVGKVIDGVSRVNVATDKVIEGLSKIITLTSKNITGKAKIVPPEIFRRPTVLRISHAKTQLKQLGDTVYLKPQKATTVRTSRTQTILKILNFSNFRS